MIHVAIVDDDKGYQSEIKDFIQTYSKEKGEQFTITTFNSGMEFITDYKPVYDIAFLDIEMPLMDGMTTARRLRQVDRKICIVFVTKMAQYAIGGYEVNAVDFVVKPLKYYSFISKLEKAIGFVRMHAEKEVLIKNSESCFRLPVSQINYVLMDKHYLVYNTALGEIRERGTMENVEKQLRESGFAKCNSGCLVNLRMIQQVTQTYVVVNGEQLPLSRRRTNEFKKDLASYLRGGKL